MRKNGILDETLRVDIVLPLIIQAVLSDFKKVGSKMLVLTSPPGGTLRKIGTPGENRNTGVELFFFS